MELKWLEDFLSLARTRNFSRSSEERNVTQPAFSRRIKALESWVGTELIDRRVFPAALTPEGRIFRDTAETIVERLYSDRAQFRKNRHDSLPSLRIAAATTLNLNFIPGWLNRLEQQVGPITSRVKTENFSEMVTDLSEGNVDLVLQYSSGEAPVLFETSRFDSVTLSKDRMLLVSPVDAAGNPLHDLQHDSEIPYFGYSSDGYFKQIESLIFARHHDTTHLFRRVGESPTSEFLKRMAQEFGATTLLPESCALQEIEQGRLAQIGGDGWTMVIDIHAYRLKDGNRPIVNRIWDAIS